MGRIDYDETEAAAFRATRHVPRDGLARWRDAVGADDPSVPLASGRALGYRYADIRGVGR